MTFRAAVTVPCRCNLAPPPRGATCDRCNGSGHRLVSRDIERGVARPDFELTTDPKDNDMALPTTKSSREARDPRDARILLVAPPKTGKTTLAAAWAPDTTLILDTHRGSALLDGEHYVQPVHTFKEFENAVDDIVNGNHQFRTIVVDLVEDIYKFADRAGGEQFKQVAAGLVEYGKGTSYAEAVFRQAVDKLLAAPVGVWFLSHVETVQDGNQTTYVPKIDKRVRTYVEGACDFCLLADAQGPNRKLHTAPSARYQVGTRVPLPNPLPLDARRLYVEIAKGLAAPKPSENTTTTTKEMAAA